ncbi:alpha/beta hydrolase [Paenibacillus taichungensis]|uniref:alpha/beta hydrolase n=1 Tax=Paenibacillus taichungensis TaxID=484184 RepID=UPI0039A64FD8
MKRKAMHLITILCLVVMFLPTVVFAEDKNETSIIVATGKDVPTGGILGSLPEKYPANAVEFVTQDGVKLTGYVLGNSNKGITLGHENGWMVDSWLPFAERLVKEGYMVILWAFRNDEPSDSVSGEATYRRDLDVLAAAQVLRERGATKILAMGASIGGTSTAVAAPNIPELVGLGILSSPRQFGVSPPISALEAVKKVEVPSFFAVSEEDPTGSYYDEVKALYEASASKQKQFNILHSSEHGTDMLSEEGSYSKRSKEDSTVKLKQERIALADKLLLFVNNSFGQTTRTDGDRNETSKNTTDYADSSKSSDNTSDYIDKNKTEKSAFMNPAIIGVGILFLLAIVASIIVKKKR